MNPNGRNGSAAPVQIPAHPAPDLRSALEACVRAMEDMHLPDVGTVAEWRARWAKHAAAAIAGREALHG